MNSPAAERKLIRRAKWDIGSYLPWQMIEVDVATAEDDANELIGETVGVVEQDGDGDGGRGFDNELHALPDEAHGVDDLGLGHSQNFGYALLDDGKGKLAERGAKAVGDRRGILDGNDVARGKRAAGIVGLDRFGTKNLARRTEFGDRQRGTAQQPAATDRCQHDVERFDFSQ